MLVERAVAGDQQAFRQLVEHYQRRVFAVALGVLRDEDKAYDAAQDAFVRVYKHLDKFKGDSSFYTWLYRIVVNLCIDQKRRQKRQREVDYDDTMAHSESFSSGPTLASVNIDNPLQAMRRKELVEHMDEALQSLTEDHRTILILREMDGLSYEEIAEVLELPRGTVMSRLYHARKSFQAVMVNYLKR